MSTGVKSKFIPVPQYIGSVYEGKIRHEWSNLSPYYNFIDKDDIVSWRKREQDGSIIMRMKLDENGFNTKYKERLLNLIKIYNIFIGMGWDPKNSGKQLIDVKTSKIHKDENGEYINMYLWINYSEDQIRQQDTRFFKKEDFVIDGVTLTYYSFGTSSLDKNPNTVVMEKCTGTLKKGRPVYDAPKGSITRKNDKGEDETWYDWDPKKLENTTIKKEDTEVFDGKTYYRFGHCTVLDKYEGHEWLNVKVDNIDRKEYLMSGKEVADGEICENGEPILTIDNNVIKEQRNKCTKYLNKYFNKKEYERLATTTSNEPFAFEPWPGFIAWMIAGVILLVILIFVAFKYFRKRPKSEPSDSDRQGDIPIAEVVSPVSNSTPADNLTSGESYLDLENNPLNPYPQG